MNARTDPELLRDYTDQRSEAAFGELVRRHVDFVYSAALRMARNAHLAEDVTQGVFVALAQKAGELADRPVLSGWLHRTARNIAANAVRSEARRRSREQEAAAMNPLQEPDVFWEQIGPHLDAALGELNEPDRDALLLRYFEGKSAHEIAQAFSISEDAAQKRVSRAIDRLREAFGKRGITVSAGGMVVLITGNAVQAAPTGLAAAISAAAVAAGAAVHASNVIAATKAVAMTTMQKAIIGATLAVAATTAGYSLHHAAQLKDQLDALRYQQSAPGSDVAQLQEARDEDEKRIASLQAENEQLKADQHSAELQQLRDETARLRGEVTRLEYEANNPASKFGREVATKVNLLRQAVARMQDKQVPEFQFLTAQDWADVASKFALNTEDDDREAMSLLRQKAEDTFLNDMMKNAFKKYLAANNNVLPADLSLIKPYFDVPVTDAMLGRYQLLQTGTVDPTADLVKLAVTVDPDYDSTHAMSINGAWGSWFNNVKSSVDNAANEFAKDNYGARPTYPSQVMPYLKNPLDPVTVQKYLDEGGK